MTAYTVARSRAVEVLVKVILAAALVLWCRGAAEATPVSSGEPRQMETPAGFIEYVAVLPMEASAYYPGPESTGPWADGFTATGLRAGYGVAAVDPAVIPLGTMLYIPGYGIAVAADVGSAIRGARIDLCFDTYREAIYFGRRTVDVYVLSKGWAERYARHFLPETELAMLSGEATGL